MDKAVNDATLVKLGDIFQYLIALRDCFELEDQERIQIEINGDVSLINDGGGRFQKEVKHHLNKQRLRERSIDLWKTLANWYEDYARIKDFSALIFYTTVDISKDSVFAGWNDKEKEDKLNILKRIGSEVKTREEKFREQYNRIFSEEYNESQLLLILDKFTIESSRKNIVGVSDEFTRYIGHIPKENRDAYIGALLGQILIKVKNPPHNWEVTRADFDEILEKESVAHGCDREIPLPAAYADESVSDEEASRLKHKKFVSAIRDIQYDKMIPDAISDYWKTDMTIIRYFQDNLVYLESLDSYMREIEGKLKYEKEDKILDLEESNSIDEIKLSKRLYNTAMRWDAKDFGTIIRNQDFFQHGVIHNIVDQGKFNWKVGDE